MTKGLKKILSIVGMVMLLSAITLSTMECSGGGSKAPSSGSGSDRDSSPGSD